MTAENKKKDTAIGKPYDIVTLVTTKLRAYTDNKELVLPANYSIENALKSAWLTLQETVNKDKQLVLEICSRASIANALLDMAVQGLNPGKDQCYFIAYGTKLMCQRSYFGTMAVAQRVANASHIWAEVVYQGDDFEYSIEHNRKTISKHTQKIDNIKANAIVAAYCVIEFSNYKPAHTEIMTIDQIKKAWAKSKTDTAAPSSVHSQFPEEMAKRTVTNRACKALINSSSDDNLFLEHFNRSDEEQVEAELEAEIEEKADKDVLEIDSGPTKITDESHAVDTQGGGFEIIENPIITRDPDAITTYPAMLKACFDDFHVEKERSLYELGAKTEAELVAGTESPADCYRRIAAVMDGPDKPKDKPGF